MKLSRFLLLALCSVGIVHADTYYEKTTIPPKIGPYAILENGTAATAAPSAVGSYITRVFDVMNYGAKCDSVTNDNTAFANMLTAAKAFYNLASFTNIAITLPPLGNCKVNVTLDFTGFNKLENRVIVEGHGAEILSNVTGSAAIDAMDSQNMFWQNLTVYAFNASGATTGIQMGRTQSNIEAAGNMTFLNVDVRGKYTIAACYDYASEGMVWLKSKCINTLTTGGFGYINDGENHWNLATLAVGGQTVAPDTATSNLQHTFIGQTFENSSSLGAPLWVEQAQSLDIIDSYGLNQNSSGSCVWIYAVATTLNDYSSKRNRFELHCETVLVNEFIITGPGSGGAHFTATPKIRGLEYQDSYVYASTNIFKIDPAANITGVTLENAKLNLAGGPSGSVATVFDTPGNWIFTGDAYTWKTGLWNGTTHSGAYCVDEAGTKKCYTNGEVGGAAVYAAGQITSAQATGSPPFVVSSTTNVPNLNASLLGGLTFATANAAPAQNVWTCLVGSSPCTWTKPGSVNGYAPQFIRVITVGGGGGGGSGALTASATASSGGGGGGGAATAEATFAAASVGSSVVCTVGAGGNGGAVQSTNSTAGLVGTTGGNTTFAMTPTLTAFGGGGGAGGQSAAVSGGGGGGGTATAGGVASGSTAGTAGSPLGSAGGAGVSGGSGGMGAGGGGGPNGAAGVQGGASVYASGAGGSGGGVTSGPAATNGGAGGGTHGYPAINGGAGNGTAGDAPNGVVGGGRAGAGGASSSSSNGFTGGAGNSGSGGGGGGSALNGNNSGAGGKGGDGYCEVITSY